MTFFSKIDVVVFHTFSRGVDKALNVDFSKLHDSTGYSLHRGVENVKEFGKRVIFGTIETKRIHVSKIR